MLGASKQSHKLQTACDRCYKLKNRCTRQSVAEPCGRCDRLGLVCETVRPPRRAGRRVKEPRCIAHPTDAEDGNSSERSTAPSRRVSGATASTLNIGQWIESLEGFNQSEKDKLLFLLDHPESLNSYLVCPIFQDAERRSLAALLPTALPTLKDAYFACAGALRSTHLRHNSAAEVDDGHVNMIHAVAAMKTLRALPVSTPQDAALCLSLGVSLTLFIYSAVGHGVYEISRHCLSMIRPFLDTDMLGPDAEPWVTFLAMLEMMECLVHRRMPTIRTPWQQSIAVDRHMGLSAPLLPYYYDLCVISHSLAKTTDTSYMALIEKQLGRIQAEIEAWQPSQPDDFIEQFNSVEVVHLLAQARLYRLAALLVGHRLRYKFGEHDDQAGIWANEIMSELELARRVTKQWARCVTVPFVVAAVEMRDTRARSQALQNADKYVNQFTPMVQKATRTFLSKVWWERDSKVSVSWFDSIHKPCVVLSSIDTALFGC